MRARSTVAAVAFAAVVAACAASCWHPSLDTSASASELTASRLGEPVVAATIEYGDWYDMEGARFVPRSAEAPTSGLLVTTADGRLRLVGVTIDPSTGTAYPGGWNETDNRLGEAALVLAAPDGTEAALVVCNPWQAFYVGIASCSPIASPVLPPATRLGAGSAAVDGTTAAELTVLAMQEPGSAVPPAWSSLSWASGAPDLSASTAIDFTDEAIVDTPGAFLAAGDYLYLSCGLEGGARRIYRWAKAGGGPTVFDEERGPLIGTLADGRLLAESENVVTVLDGELEELFSFPAGTLRFVGERYDADGGRMLCVFSRCAYLRERGSDEDVQRLRLEVYELASSELATLAR